ncbi:MAG: hypothetical protein VX484_02080, partial [Chloroflexota bacterium]|nr:hypothetical protein [Chloroflexota bacterium]
MNDNGLTFAASTVRGALTATATAGDITDSGALAVTGSSTFTAADGQSATLNNSNNFDGTVTFVAAASGNLKNVTITDTTALDLGALTLAQVAGAGGNLTVTTGGALTDSGALVIPGTTTITATGQVVELDHTSNNFATILFGSSSNAVSSVEVVDTNAIVIGASKSTGNFTVTAGGDVTDSGTVTVGGNLSVTTSASDGLINMGTLEVDGTIALDTNGNGAATVVNDAGIEFAASTVRGALTATATTGNITQGAAVAVTGTSSFTTSESNGTITLSNTGNAFASAVTLSTTGSTAHATIDNGTTTLDIAASSVGGNLTLTSGAATDGSNYAIMDSGTVTVGGNLIATTNANSGVINMGTLAVTGTIT